ncbi:hypothetical protein ASPCAL02732 [Aspergillus calidoustus]|jgi:hypothetical protein|uniref:Uncharacterized protein n=1 Tax=Aspergillus calidoustus TaxID=454130 RepID=A0A0U5GMH8_ASPCI|nr:hypothetical protein ASPCAL02732 [Aspergillus calidoustus]
MAGEEDPNRNKQTPSSPERSRQWPDDENPFVAFRRFADEQISSMLQSVMGLPSISTHPQSDRWTIFADEQSYRDAQMRQRQRQDYNNNNNGSENGDTSESRTQERSSTQDNSFPLGPSRSRWSGPENLFDIDMFFDSFFDRFWLDDHVSSRFFQPYHRPLFSSMMSADSPAWPVNYLMFSPYSPLHLERQARYQSQRDRGVFSSIMSSMSPSSEFESEEPRWREAFEDLLRLENGKPMLDREPNAVVKPESGKDWLQGLVKRGSLGDHWKYAAGSDSQPWSRITLERADRGKETDRALPEGEKSDTSVTKETEYQPLTELDLYDRFLADIEARERDFFGDFHHSPLLRFLLEDRRRGRDAILPSEKEHGDEDTETWLELVSGGNRHSVPEPPKELTPSSAPAVEAPPAISPAEKTYVVSTQISTDRVRLPDGSIQTKTVKTKRFSDGREETNEATEVVNPPQRDQHSNDQQGSTPDQKNNGWFWKD